MDPMNPVIQLCARGMQAEAEGRPEDAQALFLEAWQAGTNDYDRCIAAHYVARHQRTAEDRLRWNQECLDRADAVGDDRVKGFYPSLHVNLGQAHQELGDRQAAHRHYAQAAVRIDDAADGPYREGLRYATKAGLSATSDNPPPEPTELGELLAKLCARGDLPALGLLLPAYLGNLGTADDRARLVTAMHMVHAGRSLLDEERALLRSAIAAMAKPFAS